MSEGANVRFGSKADISQCNRHGRFTPESGHWVPFANVLAPYSRLAARPSSSGPTYFARLLVEREIARWVKTPRMWRV